MKKKIFIAAAVFICRTAIAQDSTKLLNEVVVTATKFAIKQSQTGQVLTVITQQQLQLNKGKSLTELLNTQAGLMINGSSNAPGSNQDVYLLGASTGKTLILIDGIPAYDVSGISGAFDLNLMALNQIERIEILKGSQSTLYGSDAMAGVINIITKKGNTKKINATINFSAASYNTYKTDLGLNGTMGKTNYSIQFTKLNSQGFSSAYDSTGNKNFDKDGINENVFRANIQQKINDKLLLHFTSQLSKYTTDLDAGAFIDDADYTATIKTIIAGVGVDYNFKKNSLHFNYSYNKTRRNYLNDSISVEGFYNKGEYNGITHFAEAYANLFLKKNVSLLIGADFRVQKTTQNYLSISAYGPYSTAIGDSAKVNQWGGYALVVLKNIKKINCELGGRYNNFNKYGNAFTFSFSPSYLINNNIKLFTTISSGFKVPSLYQIYSEYRNKITELKPEKSFSVETGVQYNNDNLNIRAVYFIRNVKDLIAFYSASAPPYDSYYVNADKQKDKGLELEATIKIGKIIFTANYTHLDGFLQTKNGVKDSSFFNLYRRPKQVFNANAGLNICKKWTINLGMQIVSKSFEAYPPTQVSGYYTCNVYSSYRICKNATVFIDIKNISNQKYFEVLGYNAKKRNATAGIAINF